MAPASTASTDSDDEKGMDDLITLINRLQDVVTASKLPPEFLDLPQIAVVGEQSAGKSSVLENIVGRDFLPRGTGIVTRCPLVLQLIQSDDKEYAEFLHLEGKQFTDYSEVKQEILNQTEKQCGRSKKISEQPINLKIYSPTVPHLTLVDLPGLTKNAVGDQPADIEVIIRNLILKYIKQENTLILAVTSATHDLVCSDSLQLAETIDPQRLRTIGIITKLDMMDAGTDARKIIQNKIIPLKRGYVGLVNRSQEDIDKNHTILMAQKKEKRFLQTHPAYKDIANKMGTKYLQTRLSEQLCQHIKEKLPTMRAQVRKEHQRVKRSLDAMNAFEEKADDTWIQPRIIEFLAKMEAGQLLCYAHAHNNTFIRSSRMNIQTYKLESYTFIRDECLRKQKNQRNVVSLDLMLVSLDLMLVSLDLMLVSLDLMLVSLDLMLVSLDLMLVSLDLMLVSLDLMLVSLDLMLVSLDLMLVSLDLMLVSLDLMLVSLDLMLVSLDLMLVSLDLIQNICCSQRWWCGGGTRVVQKFIEEVHKQMEGLSTQADNKVSSGGARLNDCYYTEIYPLLNQVIFFDKQEVYTLWKNMSGYQNMMFFTQQAFNAIIKKYLVQYKEPLEMSTNLSSAIIKSAIENCMGLFDSYPYLKQEITRLMIEELQQLYSHLKAQKAFMNIYHPDFKRGSGTNTNPAQEAEGGTLPRNNSNVSLNESEISYPTEEIFVKRNEIMKGDINIHSPIAPTRAFHFILTFEKLAWFKNEYDSRPKQIITIEGLRLDLANSGKPGPKRYQLQKQGTRRSDNLKIIISFRNAQDEDKWMDAFMRVGIDISFEDQLQARDKSVWHRADMQPDDTVSQAGSADASDVETTTTVQSENDPRHNFSNDPVLDQVMHELNSYAMIIGETVHDITPKYISYFLVCKTLKYCKRKLLADVQKEDPTSLMRVSDEQLSKRDELHRIYKATETALRMMGEVGGFFILNKMPNSTCSIESDEGLSEVIALINKLQDVVSAANLPPEILDLPQMAVVGEQSSGKSSVLENIVGRDFLPRGTEIVTRCPLVLQLIHSKHETYAEFLHLKGKKFTNFEEVKAEIESQTDKEAGAQKAISEKPINLKIFSPDVPHLTLVDLPGLTKNPVGNQPANIEEVIRKLILKYITQENTLILAVTTATQDLVNSVALQLAKTVDPEGLRTIGIITKLDLMDTGTDARNILLNKIIPLRRGYIGLVNRNQDDIEKKRDIKVAHEKERRFYNTHKAYRDIADKMGSKYLRERLSDQLCQHIKDRLPAMRAQVKKENQTVKRNLEAMNAFHQNLEPNWQQPKIIELIQKFTEEFHKHLEGQAVDVEGQTLSGGAKLNNCFYTQIYPLLNQAVTISKKELFILWRNMVGYNNMMFFTQQAFNNIVKKLLKQYKEPLEMSTYLAANIVKESVNHCLHRVTEAVIKFMSEQITINENSTKEHLLSHLRAQKSFINNYHPDFMKQDDLYADKFQSPDTGSVISEPRQSHTTNSIIGDDNMSIQGDEYFNKRNEIMQGNIIVHAAISPKTYYFILTLEKLAWFRDEMDPKPRGTVLINGLNLTINKKSKTRKYDLQRTGSSKRDNVKIVVSFKTRNEEDSWLDAFRSVGVILTVENGPSQPDVNSEMAWNYTTPEAQRKTDSNKQEMKKTTGLATNSLATVPVKPEYDPRTDFANDPVLEEVAVKLFSYMKIIDETIHDITPKYLSYFLIYKTLKYTKLKLLSDVQKEDMANLMRLSDDEMNKQEEYFRIYNMTTNAMKLMGEVSNASKPSKKKSTHEVLDGEDDN
uniref:dynamin GTPase n=1 Tax=Strigamia maritima TaxID=126957 RepID=T1IXU0_STRMM